MIVRVFLLSDPLAAFHTNPVTNETPWLLTSSLSSRHIKMFLLFFYIRFNKPLPPYRYV
jgi:hypothetical protein